MSRLIIQNAFILYNAANRAGATFGKAIAAERPKAIAAGLAAHLLEGKGDIRRRA